MGKKIDMTGWVMKEHGVPNSLLIVIEEDKEYRIKNNLKASGTYWKCQCQCGNFTTALAHNIRKGYTTSCGCLLKSDFHKPRLNISPPNKLNLIGNKYGNLLVLKDSTKRDNRREILWLCKCDCGNQVLKSTSHLTTGNTISCGCIKSKGENKIQQILIKNNIPFIPQQIYKDCFGINGGYLRYDFYVNNEFLLEFDGIQHFKYNNNGWNNKDQFEYTQQHDKIKNEYAKSHNIPLKRIPYLDQDKLTLEDIMGDKYLINN